MRPVRRGFFDDRSQPFLAARAATDRARALVPLLRQRAVASASARRVDADAQLACAEAAATIDELTATLHRNFARMEYHARRGEQTPLELRLQYKYQSAAVADRCVESAAKLFKCVGGSGLFETHPFGRIYADLIAARQHVSNQSQVSGRSWGAVLLGLENPDLQI